MRRVLSLALLGFSACGGGSLGDTATACENLIVHCPKDYAWSPYLTTGQASCVELLECTYDFYSDACRTRVGQLVDCAADLRGPDGCAGCDAIAVDVMQNCPFPAECL